MLCPQRTTLNAVSMIKAIAYLTARTLPRSGFVLRPIIRHSK